MKSMALVVVALGMLLAMATPSLAAHGYWGPHYHYHGYVRPYYYGGYAPVVVAPAPIVTAAPVYGYTAYPPAVAPAYSPVVPSPYYYRAPGVTFGYRGRGVSVGVGF